MKKTKLILIFLVIAFLAAAAAQAGNAFVYATDEKNEKSSNPSYYNGKKCVPNQVIIVYDDSLLAQESEEIMEESSREMDVTEKSEGIESFTDDNSSSGDGSSEKTKEKKESYLSKGKTVKRNKNALVVEIQEGLTIDEYIDEAASQPGVKYIQPNYIYTIDATVNDSVPNSNTVNNGWFFYAVDVFSAWDYGFGDSDIVIGVIDTGVDIDHPDLEANILAHYDTADEDGSGDDTNGHGTMVSGFIAAVANNSMGTAGIAPSCKLIVVDAFSTTTSATTVDICEAIDYLIQQDVDVINMSFGALGDEDPELEAKLQLAYESGIVLVAACGNDNSSEPHYPSDSPYVISVMASTIDDDLLWTNSNFGLEKSITAPGVYMKSTAIGGGYSSGSGTSFASPIVAGAAALLLSIDDTLTPDEVEDILCNSADDTAKSKTIGGDEYGAGRLNIAAAVESLLTVTGISVTPEDAVLEHNETLQLTAEVFPDVAANKNVIYSSNDETVATVDSAGLVTAGIVNNGTAIITAETEDGGYTDTCMVYVVDSRVEGVDLTPESDHIDVGETLQLTAQFTPADATNKNVTYSSSDDSIAEVDAAGLVTGKSMGEATITVTTQEGGYTDTCILQIGYPLTGVSIDDGQVEIGGTLQLNPVFAPANATNKTVTYSSDNELIASVDASGLVTGVSLGRATITVVTEEGSFTDTCVITSGHFVESVELSPDTIYIDIDGYSSLTAEVLPVDATDKNVTYESSDETIATVDAIGVVWGHTAGTTEITVTTEDGGFTDTTLVTVVQHVEEVQLDIESYNMVVGETLQLEAEVLPSNATYKDVIYYSSDETIATVDATGVVTSHSLGDAIITAESLDGALTDTCVINVVEEIITSSIYTVNRKGGYYEDVAIETSVLEIINSVDNLAGEVHVYNYAMEEVTEGNVSTGYYIRLIISGQTVDEVRIIIEGDCSPDTILDIIDYTLIRLHILKVSYLAGIELEAADVNDDGIIDIIDYTLVRLHILKVNDLYN